MPIDPDAYSVEILVDDLCLLMLLPMTGHTANIEEPELFNQHVAEFLATVESGRWGRWKK